MIESTKEDFEICCAITLLRLVLLAAGGEPLNDPFVGLLAADGGGGSNGLSPTGGAMAKIEDYYDLFTITIRSGDMHLSFVVSLLYDISIGIFDLLFTSQYSHVKIRR
ncbi:hypothetical protein ACP4OV_000848 [Aristida adscensionis]